MVKVFPANLFGPQYFKDVLAPMPHLKLTPTGGVDLTTAADWLKAGAVCLGVGSSLVKKDLIKDISAINDESGRQHAVRIVIDLKRDADPELVMRQLFQYTPCEITVSMINIALVNRQPRTMGLKELIQHFIEHRREVITRRTRHLLRKAQRIEEYLNQR